MNQVICIADSLRYLLIEIQPYLNEGYVVVVGSFQVLNSKIAKIGGDESFSEYLCILEKRQSGDINDLLKVLDPDEVVKDGDLRVENGALVEVPSIYLDELVGSDVIFRLK